MNIDFSRINVQVALDMLDLESALGVCEAVHQYVDVFEVGTPLIKSVGIQAVREIRKRFPDHFLVADMKTIDTGQRDSMLAFNAGADAIIFQATSPRQTIKQVTLTSRENSRSCFIDSLGINDMIKFQRIVADSKADVAIVHTGIDEQQDGFRPFERLQHVVGKFKMPPLAVAGGISPSSLPEILKILKQGIIIVGASITNSSKPLEVASDIRNIILERQDKRSQ